MAGSRNHECRISSGSTDSPLSSRWALICSQTSRAISGAVHAFAGLPLNMPGVSQSETSTDRQSTTDPSP
jgi:hypothetical protein